MSGHNKWSKVKRKKEVLDAKKSKIFSEIARQLTVASRESGGDKNSPTLRVIIDKARGVNMPNDNIARAIEKGAGAAGAAGEEVLYEVYGPAGSAILIRGYTDNKNRTSQEIKHLLSKAGLALSPPGSVMWAFIKNKDGYVPQTKITIDEDSKEKLIKIIEDLETHDDIEIIYTNTDL